jgi:hypothetical protein
MKSLFVSPQKFFSEMVEKGFAKRKIQTHPQVQSYLVQILEHYLDARNLYDDEVDEFGHRKHGTLAEMFLLANQSPPSEKFGLLKKLGDKALYISGFFGDSLARKVVDIDYYADMGGAAYSSLADTAQEDTVAAIYRTFSKRFLDFVEVLTYISQESMVQNDQNLLRLYDRYLRTGSPMAQERLVEMGVLTVSADQLKHIRQD